VLVLVLLGPVWTLIRNVQGLSGVHSVKNGIVVIEIMIMAMLTGV
jgi:hypothetical protein